MVERKLKIFGFLLWRTFYLELVEIAPESSPLISPHLYCLPSEHPARGDGRERDAARRGRWEEEGCGAALGVKMTYYVLIKRVYRVFLLVC